MNAPLKPPNRGAWLTLTLTSGRSMTCRFVWSGTSRMDGVRRWCVDQGAYGKYRDDCYIHEDAIQSATPAVRPALLLSFCDSYGKRRHVGRYMTRDLAEHAIGPMRSFAKDVWIEAAP